MAIRDPIDFPNGMRLRLQFAGERFLGIGEVSLDGLPLRAAHLPWTVYSESEGGVRFEDFTLLEVEEHGDGRCLVFAADGRWLPRLQAADAMGDARVVTRRLARPRAIVRWRFTPITETIHGREWTGLAMQLGVDCPGHPIHWLIEDTTWEIGGSAAGCTLIQQDISTIDLEQRVEAESAFSTIEKFHTDGWGGAYPMDMMPRAAGAAFCDFQVKAGVALCLFAERPSLTRARIEKHADEDVIHYTDRPFFALGENVQAPERKLLVHRQERPLARHEWRNLWLDCYTEVRRRLLAVFGFHPEVPTPTVWAHLWDDDLKRLGAAWTDALRDALPRYRDLGFRQVFTHGVWDSVTSDARRTKEDGNVCCPYSFTFAEGFGGAAGMRRLVDAARCEGVSLMQWFSFHISRLAPMWKEHPDWVLREANGDPWDANYHCLWAGRIRSGFGKEFMDQVCAVRESTGLDAIFWDSYQNLGVTGIDWSAPDKAPQAEEIWRMQAELQRRGFATQRPEIITPFGVGTVAVYGFADDRFRRRLWADSVRNDDVFALIDCAPAFFTEGDAFTADRLSPERYFWLAGHRVLPALPARPWPDGAPGTPPAQPGGELCEAYGRVNRLYLAALPSMRRLRLVEGGTHTVWLDDGGQPAAIWAFADGSADHHGPVTEVEGGRRFDCSGDLPLRAGQVYLLGVRAGALAGLAGG